MEALAPTVKSVGIKSDGRFGRGRVVRSALGTAVAVEKKGDGISPEKGREAEKI